MEAGEASRKRGIMDRRDFLKSIGAAFALSLPVEVSASLTITGWELRDGWESLVTLGGPRMEGGQAFIEATFEAGRIWEYLRLVDSEGRQWQSIDEGITWQCGLMEFSLEGEE